MKKVLKLLAVVLSFVLVLTSFAACGDKKTDAKDEETKKSEEAVEAPKGDATHDGKLIATWDAEVEVPLDEGMDPMKIKATMDFKEDGTFTMSISDESIKSMVVQVFMAFFGMESEADFEAYITSQGMTVDEFVENAKKEMDMDEMSQTGTWTTDGNGNLTQVTVDEEGEDETETFKYTVSEDGKSAELFYEDDELGTQTLKLTKIK